MQAFVSFLVFCQALGAIGGALSAVGGEFAYARAARDGNIDAGERAHLTAVGRGLRFGMTLLLLASLGLVVAAYATRATLAPALTASYWSFIALSLAVIAASWALSRRRVSFKLGSAAVLTGWWFLAYFALGQFPNLGFGSTVALYVVAVAIFYAVLAYARMLLVEAARSPRS